MKSAGWICLHRKVLDNPTVTQSPEAFALWVWLLLNAEHSESIAYFRGERITLEPGQLVASRAEISAKTGISEAKVRHLLTCFQNDQLIDQQKTSRKRVISIVSWHKYQKNDQQIDQQKTNRKPTYILNNNITNKQYNKGNKKQAQRETKTAVPDDSAALYRLLVEMEEDT